MKRNTTVAVIFSVAILASVAWAITLQASGHTAEAIEFMKWAFGGLAAFAAWMLFFGTVS